MSHPRTACSTTSTNLCAKCAPLYTHLHGHIPADRLNCPSLTTYPIHLKIRIRPATNAAEVQEIHNICRDIARVMTPQVQNMFGLAPGTPVPMAGRKEFRREYTDLFILVDLPWEVDVSDWNVIDEILGVAGLIPLLAAGQEEWQVCSPESEECAQHFRLGFWIDHLRESRRAAERRRRREQQPQQAQQVVLPAFQFQGGVPMGFMLFPVPFVRGPNPR
ncbi:hypothetical protein ASPCAL10154 [Aspergillus calidoustus]|uniref:Uncharacterized protein n=1 Tax=Aspergillus calidoustus TaxID=454130 RepID=A0A0U5G5V3_ASPCI|nr:hypothetical protein ASPCAL10154 [Aspergillus calidoustus]